MHTWSGLHERLALLLSAAVVACACRQLQTFAQESVTCLSCAVSHAQASLHALGDNIDCVLWHVLALQEGNCNTLHA